MSFANKCTVIYKVWTIDRHAFEEELDARRKVGVVSVRTDRKSKSGRWSISNKAIRRALVESGYLRDYLNIEISGEDDGVLDVQDVHGDEANFELEYERHHDVPEKSSSLFSEPSAGAKAPMSRSNPLSSLSTGEKVGIAAAGVAALSFVGYLIWKSQQSAATAAALPVVQTPMPGTTPVIQPTPGPVDTTTPPSTGGVVYDPNLLLGNIIPPAPGG